MVSGRSTEKQESFSLREEDRALMKTRKHALQVWTLIGVCVLFAVLGYVLNVLAIPVGIVIWTIIICFMLAGPVDYFQRHGIGRMWGTLLAFVVLLAALGVIAALLFSPVFGISDQFSDMLSSAPDFVRSLSASANAFYESHADILQSEQIRSILDNVMDSFASVASGIASASATNVISAGTSIANVFLTLGFAIVVAFWLLIELPNLRKEVSRLMPEGRHDDIAMLYATFSRVMSGYIKGTLLQCAIIGVGCGILFTIIGTPNPAALGLITGILNIVPVVARGSVVRPLRCQACSPARLSL